MNSNLFFPFSSRNEENVVILDVVMLLNRAQVQTPKKPK